MDVKRNCPHCYPNLNNHLPNKWGSVIDYYLFDPTAFLLKPLSPASRASGRFIKRAFLEFSTAIKHIKLSKDLDRKKLSNSTLVFWDEAKKRNLDIYNLKLLNKHTEHFCLILNGRKYFYDSNPIFLVGLNKSYDHAAQHDDKENLRKTLALHHLPCPQGRAFISKSKALAYGQALGFPLIVKPSFSTHSRHVSLNIQSEQELEKAIKIAKQVNYKIIVEKHIPGEVFRALTLDGNLIACNKRQAGRIIGNGKDTVEKLIEQKNKHPYRGEPWEKNFTLFKVKLTKQLEQTLKDQGVRLNTKLAKGVEIKLSHKMNAGNGADIINVTDSIHPENKLLLERTHRVLNLPLSGLDFICEDISLPWQKQQFAIIENNSLPGVSQHHYPSAGEPINAAGIIWDWVLARLRGNDKINSPIPPSA